jgi:hypothetical protein
MSGGTKSSPGADRSLARSARARAVRFEPESFVLLLEDGRSLSIPLDWYPKLRDAAPEQRDNWTLVHDGLFVAWAALDYLLFVNSLLTSTRPLSEDDPFPLPEE